MFNTVSVIHIILSSALFIFMWQVVGRLLLKPFFEVVYEREAKTSGSEELTHKKRDELRRLEADLNFALQEARNKGVARKDELIHAAKSEAQVIRETAVKNAAEEINVAKGEVARLRARAGEELSAEAERVAGLLVSRVMETPSGRVIH